MNVKYCILKKANVDHIKKAIIDFQWEKSFQNMRWFIYLIELCKISHTLSLFPASQN